MDYFDLGSYTRKITTAVPETQLWFDRGLNWLFGFNHAEAIACFKKALKHDADCAMAYCIAYAAGPPQPALNRYDPAGRPPPSPPPTMRCRAPWLAPSERVRSSRR
jgi:hypothetical protein